MLRLGDYPTPIISLERAAAAAGVPTSVRLWCKRDDLTSPLYGGNKVRKLERLLEEATASGARRIVTVGAVASHHVLASAIFGKSAGLEVEAVLFPQPRTEHAEDIVRAGARVGLRAFPVRSLAAVPLAVARRLAHGSAYFVAPGGSSVTGALGYVAAAEELAEQIATHAVPRPDVLVVALGSGGTVAGLLVGLARAGLLTPQHGLRPMEVVAVQVVDPPLASSAATLALAIALLRRLGEPVGRSTLATLSRALRVAGRYLGRGYGHATSTGHNAELHAQQDGLVLDTSYTAKAFAAALDEARVQPPGTNVLYWHTLSAPGPLAKLLEGAPPLNAVDPNVRALLRT